MKNTIISESLYQECLDHYLEVEGEDFVVSRSLPVLFFGDIEAFLKEKPRVVTVGKNPSNNEFQYSGKGKEKGRVNPHNRYNIRFPEFGPDKSNYSLEKAYAEYFKKGSSEKSINDYFKKSRSYDWFKNYEYFLQGLGYSYYGEDFKRAIHTDICSPIATDPTWSLLTSDQQKLLEKKGVQIWKNLIKEIKPKLLICSFAKHTLTKHLTIKYRETLDSVRNDNNPNKPYELELYEVSIDGFDTLIVYGNANNSGPFGPSAYKERLGRACRTFIESSNLL